VQPIKIVIAGIAFLILVILILAAIIIYLQNRGVACSQLWLLLPSAYPWPLL
jgi:hypothetical protein